MSARQPEATASDRKRMPVAGPWITEREIAYATEAAATNWYDRAGDFIGRFEQAFAAETGRRFAVSLPSCTSGLHLALAALGIGPGDEVVVPDVTWIASSAPVTYVGATPVFADIDPVTWCLDVASVEACLTPRTKAVIAVDLYGSMPDMAALQRVTGAAGVALIEDAAEAVGSAFLGTSAGGHGLVSTFSFHGSKTLTTGEGGMLVADDEELFARIKVLRDHGRRPGDVSFRNEEIAFKYKMSPVQAALGLAQLERLDELVGRKRDIYGWYHERLADLPGCTLNAEPAGTRNSYWMTTVVLDPALGLAKEQLGQRLADHGIDTRPFFSPLSSLKAYADAEGAAQARERNTVSYRVSPWGVNLPSALSLTEQDVDVVCTTLRQVVGELRPVR